jgi:mRNA deadenylase 3'-5' endonuclease subunit Ccr4
MTDRQQWKGRIIARLLGQGVEADYDQMRKPVSRVDPSSLCKGSGPLCHDPASPRVNETCQSEEATSAEDTSGSQIRLDVYLFHSDSLQQPLSVSLILKSDREAQNCLNRLGISISKKLIKANSVKGGGVKNKKCDRITATCIPRIDGESRELVASGMTNEQFWGIGLKKPLTIAVSVNDLCIPLHVECNPPTVIGVATFEKFGGKIFPQIPLVIEVDTLFATRTILDWYADGNLVCRDSPSYTPSVDDANKSLALMITPVRPGHAGEGCHEAYQFKEKVAESLPENTVLEVRPEWQQPRVPKGSELRVLSYNILADQNAYSGPNREPYFPWVSADILLRSRRMPLILHEILAYHADVVCLQEVDELVYNSLLRPVLEHYNYQGFYSVKQTRGNQEGCALFWSLGRFQKAREDDCKTYGLGQLVDRYATSLEEGSEWKECAVTLTNLFERRPDLLNTINTKLGHVVQMVNLRDLDGNPLLVANTHLFFSPVAPHIRILQLFAIAHQLTIEQGPEKKPFLFCGDLNTSLKNCASLLMQKQVPKNYRDYRECLNRFQWEKDKRDQEVQYDDDFPEMRLPDSFPELVTGYPDCPDFTHYIIGFNATLDHILMSSKTLSGELRPLRQATMPTLEQVKRHQAMPSPCFPSDHIGVLCDLEWIPTSH